MSHVEVALNFVKEVDGLIQPAASAMAFTING